MNKPAHSFFSKAFVSHHRWSLGRALFLAPVVALALAGQARAQNSAETFNSGATDLTVGTNYTPNGVPNNSVDVLFSSANSYTLPLTANTTLNVGSFDDENATPLTITDTATSGTSLLTLDGGGNGISPNFSDVIYVTSGSSLSITSDTSGGTFSLAVIGLGANFDNSGTLNISTGVALSTGLSFIGSGTTTLSGVISGTSGLTFSQTGTVVLSGTNTFTGGATLQSGTLDLNSSAALGATGTSSTGFNSFTITGGSIDNTSGVAVSESNAIPVNLDGNLTFLGAFGGTHDINLGTGAVTLGGVETITVNAGTLTDGGAVADAAGDGIVKAGAGSLTFSGIVSGSGTIAVNSGVLTLSNANTNTGVVSLNGGVLIMTNDGSLGTTTDTAAIDFDGGVLEYNAGGTFNDYSSRFVSTGGPIAIDLDGHGLTFASAITSAEDTNGLVLFNSGGNTLTTAQNNTYTGTTTIYGGNLTVNGTTGTLNGTTAIVLSGGELTVGDTGTSIQRLAADPTLTLGGSNGGGSFITVRLSGNPNPTSSANSPTVSTLTIASGVSSISTASGGNSQYLDVTGASNNYLRQAGGVVVLGGGGGAESLNFANASSGTLSTAPVVTTVNGSNQITATNQILIGAISVGSTVSFVAGGVAGTAEGSVQTNVISSNDSFGSGVNAFITKNDTLTGANTVQSLEFGTAGVVSQNIETLTTNGALTVQSGGILFGGNDGQGGVINGTGSIQANNGQDFWIYTLNNTSTISTVIADDGSDSGLTKFGTGTLVLSGANTFGGAIYLDEGTLSIANAQGLGVGTDAIEFLGGVDGTTFETNMTLQANGVSFTTARSVIISGGKTAVIDTNGQSIGISGAISQAGDPTFGVPDSLGNLAKTGNGTLTLNGSVANTYTGLTEIENGTLLLDFSNFAAQTNLISNLSTLDLGFSGSFDHQNNFTGASGQGNVYTGGGTLDVIGGTTGVTSQSFNGTALQAATQENVVVNNNGGAGTTVNLGTLTRGGNSTLNINTAAGGTVTAGIANGFAGYVTDTNSTGTGFGFITNGVIGQLTGQTTLPATATSASVNYITAPTGASTTAAPYLTLTPSSGLDNVNSLTINTGGASGANVLDLGGGTLDFPAVSGLLMTGANNYTIQDGFVGITGRELIIHQTGTGTLTISAELGQTAGSNSSLTKDGSGTLILTNTGNNYTGVTDIDGGTLTVTGALGASIATVTDATYNLSGTTAGSMTLVEDQGIFNFTNTVTAMNAITYVHAGGTYNLQGIDAGNVNIDDEGTLVENSSGSIIGATNFLLTSGTVTLAGTGNTYGGATTINGGTVTLANSGALSANSVLTFTTGSVGTNMGVATLNLNGFNGSVASITGGSTSNGLILLNGGTLTTGGAATAATTYTGNIVGAGGTLVQTGTQTLTLNGFDTGFTLSVQGTTGTTTGTVAMGSATVFNATDTVSVTSGIYNLNGFNETIAGLTGTGGTVTDSGGAVTLTFGGSGSDNYQGTVTATTPTNLSINEAGTTGSVQSLAGANTYGGTTTVTSGELAANNLVGTAAPTSATGTGAVTVKTGAILGGGNGANNSLATVTTPGSLATYGSGANIPTYQNYAIKTVGYVGGGTTVNTGGNITPGNGGLVGTLTLASLSLSTGSTLTYYFNPTTDANSFLSVSGQLTLASGTGTVLVSLFGEGGTTPFTLDGTYDLIGYGAVNGATVTTGTPDLTNFVVAPGSQVAGLTYTFINDTTNGDDLIQLQITGGTAAPEPSSWAMMLGGLVVLGVVLRHKRIFASV